MRRGNGQLDAAKLARLEELGAEIHAMYGSARIPDSHMLSPDEAMKLLPRPPGRSDTQHRRRFEHYRCGLAPHFKRKIGGAEHVYCVQWLQLCRSLGLRGDGLDAASRARIVDGNADPAEVERLKAVELGKKLAVPGGHFAIVRARYAECSGKTGRL